MVNQRAAAPPSALDLMDLHLRTLFRHDRSERLVAVNELTTQPAPRLFLGRTPAGNLWRFRHDLPASLTDDLNALLSAEPVSSDLHQPPVSFPCLINALSAHAPIERVWQGPVWCFPDEIVSPNDVATIVVTDIERLSATFGGTVETWLDCQPCLAVVEHGAPVSACFCSRTSPSASEAGVETLPDYRGRGYAAAVTAAWARAVRALGRTPLYSTSWDNVASQGVARHLGLILIGADLHVT
jgi:GNAT superfamily N-acetyltransferase